MFDVLKIENWSAKDFAHYIVTKLEEKSITYEIQYPMDIILLSNLLKQNDNKGRTNHYIKDKIDQNFESFEIRTVSSLQFVFSMFDEITPLQGPKKYQKSAYKDQGPIKIPPSLQKRLEGLK